MIMKSTNDNLPTNRHSIKAGVMGVRWLRAVASFILLKTKKGRYFLLKFFSFAFIVINFFPSPKTANMLTEPCDYAGVTITSTNTNEQSMKAKKKVYHTKDEKIRHNVFEYVLAGTNYGHPAIFPKQLAIDHIKSWSNEGDLIYDCFMGSGTVAVVSIPLNRNWIGSEISEQYVGIINERVKPLMNDLFTI